MSEYPLGMYPCHMARTLASSPVGIFSAVSRGLRWLKLLPEVSTDENELGLVRLAAVFLLHRLRKIVPAVISTLFHCWARLFGPFSTFPRVKQLRKILLEAGRSSTDKNDWGLAL